MYLLIRPGRTIFEKYYLEVEENLAILSRIIEEKTEHDAAHNVTDCIDCGKEIRSNWKVCPYCGAKQHKNQHHKKKKTD
jgi:rRNA maturation endonuclease Nob1